jgi:membrane protein required for colicin V production
MQNIQGLIDYGIIIIIMVSMLMGLMRGIIREVMSLIIWSAAIMVAISYCNPASGLFHSIIPQAEMCLVIAFILVVFIVLIIGGIISRLIEQIIKATKFTITDRITGGVFGFVRGVAIIALTMAMAKTAGLIQDYSIKDSTLIANFKPAAVWLEKQLPEDMKKLDFHMPASENSEAKEPQQNQTKTIDPVEEQLKKIMNPNAPSSSADNKAPPKDSSSSSSEDKSLDQLLPPEVKQKVMDILNINNKQQSDDQKKN